MQLFGFPHAPYPDSPNFSILPPSCLIILFLCSSKRSSFDIYLYISMYVLCLNHLRVSCRHDDPSPLSTWLHISLNTRTFAYVITVQLSEQEIEIDVALSFTNLIQILYIVPLMSFIVKQKIFFLWLMIWSRITW